MSSVLFVHKRVGQHGREFELLKFRTMRIDTAGPSITAGGDPRVTSVGRILRKFKLDELPQLWNVVRGEMAFIGPRPEVPEFVDLADPVWQEVLSVKPGITDLASLVFRNEEEILSSAGDPVRYYREVVLPEKLRLNLLYQRERNWWTDLKLIALSLRYSLIPAGFEAERARRLVLG